MKKQIEDRLKTISKKYDLLDPEDLEKIFDVRSKKTLGGHRARFIIDGGEYFDFIQGSLDTAIVYKFKKDTLHITEDNFELLGHTLFNYFDDRSSFGFEKKGGNKK